MLLFNNYYRLIEFLTSLQQAFFFQSSPEWTPSYVALCKVFMTGCLFNQIIDLFSNIVLLANLELHATKFIIDPLNDDLGSLIELLATLFFTLFASILN